MNVRRQLYKKYRLEGMSAYRAAIKAGYKHSTAWNAASRVEKACNMKEFLTKKGLDDDTIAESIKEGLQAKKNKKPDFQARHKYLETLVELRGDKKPAGQNGGFTNNGVMVVHMQQIKVDGEPLEFKIG